MSDRKLLIGNLPDLSALFDDFRYFRNIVRPGHGSYTPHPPGYYFLNPGNGMSWREHKFVLYAKPKRAVVEIAQTQCVGAGLSSFEICPWNHADKALVLGRDSHHIGAPWLAFVPLPTMLTPDYLLSLPLEDYHDTHIQG